jgi:hypothetical protein
MVRLSVDDLEVVVGMGAMSCQILSEESFLYRDLLPSDSWYHLEEKTGSFIRPG